MNKFFMGFFFAFIAIAMLLGCKKETTETSSLIASEKPIQKIKAWYNAAPSESKVQTVEVNGNKIKIAAAPFWEESRYYAERNIIITPVKIGEANKDAATFKYLIAKCNEKGEIVEVNYYKIATEKNSFSKNSLSVDDIELALRVGSSNNVNGFTGSILKYDSNNKLLSTSHYQNGTLINADGDEQNSSGEIRTNAPIQCSSYIVDSWWVTYSNGVVIEVQYLYSTTYSTCPGESGGSGGGGTNNSFYIEISIEDDFLLTCPDNFTFTSITTNNLWQEAGISNAYCNLIYYNAQTQQTVIKHLIMPTMYFDMQYQNQNGGVIFSSNQAKVRAANAFNKGEYEMRKYFKSHPNASDLDLQNAWLNGADSDLKTNTYGQGKVTKFAAANPASPVVIKPYESCY